MTVGAVDCDEEGNKPLCGRYGVQGFPTIKVFGPDKQMNPYTKKVGKTPSDYNGARRCSRLMGMRDGAGARQGPHVRGGCVGWLAHMS